MNPVPDPDPIPAELAALSDQPRVVVRRNGPPRKGGKCVVYWNGYAGIAWAIVGKLDRPWFNRPVYGLVWPMTGTAMAKKFDAAAYITRQDEMC